MNLLADSIADEHARVGVRSFRAGAVPRVALGRHRSWLRRVCGFRGFNRSSLLYFNLEGMVVANRLADGE